MPEPWLRMRRDKPEPWLRMRRDKEEVVQTVESVEGWGVQVA